jgi:hypothetical protein
VGSDDADSGGFEKLDESGAADLALIGAQVYRAPTVTASES